MLTLGALVCTLCSHFLFIRIGPMAEGGRSAEVYFSEQAEAGDPKFVDKIAGHAALAPDRPPGSSSRSTVRQGAPTGSGRRCPASGSVAVVGVVRVRGAGAAEPDAVPAPLLSQGDRGQARRAEPDARPGPRSRSRSWRRSRGTAIRLVALREGKPVPGAVFHAVDADLTEVEVHRRRRRLGRPGRPRARAVTRSTPQRHDQAGGRRPDGKPYEEIREFATLAFAWPLVRTGRADPEAVALFEEALAARAAVEDDFPGFAATLAGTVDGRPFTGKVTVQRRRHGRGRGRRPGRATPGSRSSSSRSSCTGSPATRPARGRGPCSGSPTTRTTTRSAGS